jgi:hypothetical protein
MKRVGLVVVMVLSIVLLAACSEQSITSEPNSPAAGNDTDGGNGDGGGSAKVGDTITLHGIDEALALDVTVVKVVDPAKPDNNFLGPKKGNHFVAIQVKLDNVGEANYSDSPGNGAALIDADGQQYTADITDPVGPALGSPKIAPSDSRTGLITFEVAKGVEPAMFQFTLDSGFGPETGEWTL